MLSTNVSQMQQYQDMINRQQQQQIGPAAIAEQIYETNVDPNSPHVQQTPIRGAQVYTPYQPYEPQVASSRHYPRGHPDDQEKYGNLNYQRGLGSLINRFGNLGGPRQPQSAFENQFSELQNQMGGFGEQFTGLETSIGGLGESITAITDRLDSIEQGIQGLKTNDPSQAYTRMNWQPFSSWGRRY